MEIPQQPVQTPETMYALLSKWYVDQQALAKLKTVEVLERKDLVEYYFPAGQEGTNTLALGETHELVAGIKLNYNVDEVALAAVDKATFKKLKIKPDELFKTKVELSVSAYRALTPEQKAFIDPLLDIKPGTPELKIRAKSDEATKARAAAHAAETNAPATGAPAVPQYTVVEDMDDAKPGNYYLDGEGQWWQRTGDPADPESWDWDTCDDPSGKPAKPPRKPRTRKAK